MSYLRNSAHSIAVSVGPVLPLSADYKPCVAFARASQDAGEVEVLWREFPRANIGVHAGRAGLLVIDQESPEKKPGTPDGIAALRELERVIGPLPATRMHSTKSGGRHSVFRVPTYAKHLRSSQGKLPGGIECPGIDIVAGNAILRWPPSAGYAIDPASAPIATLPRAWITALTAPPRPPLPPLEVTEHGHVRYVAVALARASTDLSDARALRMLRLGTTAYGLGKLVPELSESAIEHALLEACEANGAAKDHGFGRCQRVIRKAIADGARQPREIRRR